MIIFIRLAGLLLVFFTSANLAHSQEKLTSMAQVHELACNHQQFEDNPWNLTNLYGCNGKKLFIPYELWTGAVWNGARSSCMHRVDNNFRVNEYDQVIITGPHEWKNPKTGDSENYWQRKRLDIDKIQYFTCHEKGIGRVFDSRRTRYFRPGRCKFPAGSSWRLNKRDYCENTSIEIIALGVDKEKNLTYLDFKWWYYSRGKYTLDYIYRYVPNQGMLEAWKQE